jgi:hypothetical protein
MTNVYTNQHTQNPNPQTRKPATQPRKPANQHTLKPGTSEPGAHFLLRCFCRVCSGWPRPTAPALRALPLEAVPVEAVPLGLPLSASACCCRVSSIGWTMVLAVPRVVSREETQGSISAWRALKEVAIVPYCFLILSVVSMKTPDSNVGALFKRYVEWKRWSGWREWLEGLLERWRHIGHIRIDARTLLPVLWRWRQTQPPPLPPPAAANCHAAP